MEIITTRQNRGLCAAIFDFDGTLSVLRSGWEQVMLPLMTEYTRADMQELCREYIAESTGIQTIHQMKWLCEQVRLCGNPKNAPLDPWFFKDEYNRRLMQTVEQRKACLSAAPEKREEYLIGGARAFLQMLFERGIPIYAASGTDEEDVKKEAQALDIAQYFREIHGAAPRKENCSKEAIIANLIDDCGLAPESILICGDGKVEIGLGAKSRCIALGVASDEKKRYGINAEKKQRLLQAGADAIVGDFTESAQIAAWLAL